MIYAAFTVWLLLILFMGMGVYSLWTSITRPLWINWALLPGTVVSEMAYIFGCLITGGEIKRAKLLDSGSSGGKGGAAPATQAAPRLKVAGPIIASLLAIVGCGAAILVADACLGETVIATFAPPKQATSLPHALPDSWEAFWTQAKNQLQLVKRFCETLTEIDWKNWRVPLFVYAALCLSVRLSPAGRPIRPTLAAVVVIAAAIALTGAIWKKFANLMQDIWPLLSYVWATLLFLLLATLILKGLLALIAALAGKTSKATKAG